MTIASADGEIRVEVRCRGLGAFAVLVQGSAESVVLGDGSEVGVLVREVVGIERLGEGVFEAGMRFGAEKRVCVLCEEAERVLEGRYGVGW